MAARKLKTTVLGPKERNRSFHNFNIERLVEIIKSMEPGEVKTYKELSAELRIPVNGNCYVYKMARGRLLEQEINVKTICCIGVKRLDDTGIVDESDVGLTKIRRSSVREGRKLRNARFGNLSSEQQMKYMMRDNTLGNIEHFLGPAGQKRVAERIRDAQDKFLLLESPEVAKETILRMFGGG